MKAGQIACLTAAVAALAAIAWCATETALLVRATRAAARPLLACQGNPGCLPSQLMATMGALKASAGEVARAAPQISRSSQAIAENIDGAVSDLRAVTTSADVAIQRTDARLAEVTRMLDARSGEVVAAVARPADSLALAIAEYGRLPRVVTGYLDPWMNCGDGTLGGGRDCLQSKAWWMATKADALLTSTAIWVPQYLETGQQTNQQVAGIAADIHQITAAWTRPSPWYKKALRVGAQAALIGARVLP